MPTVYPTHRRPQLADGAAGVQTAVIGSGRVGTALKKLDDSLVRRPCLRRSPMTMPLCKLHAPTCVQVVLKRGDAIPPGSGPLIIATRNDALAGIAEATPAERRGDLVFIQNGMLQPWLDSHGLGDNTQVAHRPCWHEHTEA